MSTAHFLISLLTFLAVAGIAESLCCDEIKSELKRKMTVHKLLCSVRRHRVFAKCCKGLEEEINNYTMAYKEMCTTCSGPKALGMESGKIPDSALTSSSSWSSSWAPQTARLNRLLDGCAWLSASGTDPKKSWLQVDFGNETIVTGVATQGSCTEVQWVKSYVIWYSNDAVNWKYYKEGGARKEFQGNSDQNTVVTNNFKQPIVARYVRITPQTYTTYAEMRLEYYGCRMEE